MRILQIIYCIFMLIAPIAAWAVAINKQLLSDPLNWLFLITVSAAACVGFYYMIKMINEENRYERWITYKADEVELTKKLFKQRFNAN